MNGESMIPPLTDGKASGWRQPHRRFIEVDERYALMSEQTFKGLVEYTDTEPTYACAGKMWKSFRRGKWFLRWYSDCDHPKMIDVNTREILIV